MERRACGILLHITSLPSLYGIGDLGPEAYRFVDFLKDAGQSYWQILPINQTCMAHGNSPYSSYSAFAGNLLLISPELMVKDGFLSRSDVKDLPAFPKGRADYTAVTKYKDKIFRRAFEKNKNRISNDAEFERFCFESSLWLEDYAVFISAKRQFDNFDWGRWPEDLRDRREKALNHLRDRLKDEILMEKFLQYIFFKQWFSLKGYCENREIKIIGDIPIYVSYDSADVWANPGIFKLDEKKKPLFVAGVPPDYFSATGQRWGHPVYDWEALTGMNYSWWVQRIGHNMKLFHIFRLDHFRGFVAYWEIPEHEKTAEKGRWVEVPVKDFFNTLFENFSRIPLIAEDLGVITPDVREIINMFGFPGMKVLLFAFDDNLAANPYLPHNYHRNCVVYTGTHDNNTARGWFRKDLSAKGKKQLAEYTGRKVSEKTVHHELMRLAMGSVANTVIAPMQDILGMDEKARMNIPAVCRGNWQWRLKPGQLTVSAVKRLAGMTGIYGRG